MPFEAEPKKLEASDLGEKNCLVTAIYDSFSLVLGKGEHERHSFWMNMASEGQGAPNKAKTFEINQNRLFQALLPRVPGTPFSLAFLGIRP